MGVVSKVVVIRKEEIKVQRVKSFQDMFKMNINLKELKKAALVGDFLVAEVNPIIQ